ncbi:hypothetical protein TNIN_25361 [Trichonephila inaurata madagascariensis]|uniref:Uncharacterized protein n=1 Tax=Trichonephila inaurata madagascariensis TaxID=2747483 RepID=A0A8X6YNA1_9ARAC|nr:hypothetical protein TNIN_25361 [Trichonephila inaurata madagascariensis]
MRLVVTSDKIKLQESWTGCSCIRYIATANLSSLRDQLTDRWFDSPSRELQFDSSPLRNFPVDSILPCDGLLLSTLLSNPIRLRMSLEESTLESRRYGFLEAFSAPYRESSYWLFRPKRSQLGFNSHNVRYRFLSFNL